MPRPPSNGTGAAACGLRKCSCMSLTAPSNELEITLVSFPNTRSAHGEWCCRGFPTLSSFEKLPEESKSSLWHTDVAAPAFGGIGSINASVVDSHRDLLEPRRAPRRLLELRAGQQIRQLRLQ
jgi:hypothetical protein